MMGSRRDSFQKLILLITLLAGFLFLSSAYSYAGVYSVHVASFKSIGEAEAEAGRLQALGYEAFIQKADVPGRGKWYRIYTGKFNSRQKASEAANQMKSKKDIGEIFIHKIPNMKSVATVQTTAAIEGSATESRKIRVVGNTETKRYHLPGMPYYNKVKKHHRTIFKSEQEAIEKGYYKAGTTADVSKERKNDQAKITIRTADATASGAKVASAQASSANSTPRKEKFKSLMMGSDKIMNPPAAIKEADQQDRDVIVSVPDEPDVVEPASDSAIYNRALGQLKNKQYAQALVTFKQFLDSPETSKEWGPRALRHMADCHYALGIAGDRQELLVAAEFYKNTLASFPDPRKENAWTYYRLAHTYEALKYYPEAVKQYKNLIIKYPDSIYTPESYFKIGEAHYIDGKYPEAAESLIHYLMKYRAKAKGKISYYMIAHAFYKAKQATNAEIWFRDAQKKWPSLVGVPKNIIVDLAAHKMSLRRNDEAIAPLSFFANLYPEDERIKDVFRMLAEAYRENGQITAALAVYHKMIEKYPGTKEEAESRLKMANLGLEKPGAKVFRGVSSIENYKYPMETYDDLIMKYVIGDIAEEAMLQKAAALIKKGQGRKGADVYLEFLSLFPESRRIGDASRGLKAASADLIEEYYAKKDYLAVAYVYFRSFGAIALQAGEYPQVQKIALSLKALNLMEDYAAVLKQYLKVAKDEKMINQVYVDLSEGLVLLKQYDEAEQILTSLMNKPSVKKTSLLTVIRKNLAEIAYKKEQYAQAVANYGPVIQSGQDLQNPGAIYSHYAKSLKEEKDNTQALQNYLTAVKYLSSEKPEKSYVDVAYREIGDLYVKSNKLGYGLNMYSKALDNATQNEMKLWSQFLVGTTYLKLEQKDQAESIFAQMKAAAGPESFWGKVVDFYSADIQWWNKYGYLIKK